MRRKTKCQKGINNEFLSTVLFTFLRVITVNRNTIFSASASYLLGVSPSQHLPSLELHLHYCPREEQQGGRKQMQLLIPQSPSCPKLVMKRCSPCAPCFLLCQDRHSWLITKLSSLLPSFSLSLSLSKPEYSLTALFITVLWASWVPINN